MLLRTVDCGVGQRCRAAVSNQQCCSEVCVTSVAQELRSVSVKCWSEVSLTSVAQKLDLSSIAQKCRSEVSMSNVDQKC